jgi:ABC-type Na+ efflux pump permease subunit
LSYQSYVLIPFNSISGDLLFSLLAVFIVSCLAALHCFRKPKAFTRRQITFVQVWLPRILVGLLLALSLLGTVFQHLLPSLVTALSGLAAFAFLGSVGLYFFNSWTCRVE